MDGFKFYIPLKKDTTIANDTLIGVASTLSLDRDEERMSDRALKMMVNDIRTMGVNLFGNHEHNWENTLGAIKEAELVDDKVQIRINLDDPITNLKIPMLLNKLKRGINLGLSVGGTVTEEKYEYNSEIGKKIKVIDGVKLFEISVVGIPSNVDSFVSLPSLISKSRKEISKGSGVCAWCGGDLIEVTPIKAHGKTFCSRTCVDRWEEAETSKSVSKEQAVSGKTCYECGRTFEQGDKWYYYYHGDQDDRVCEECANKLPKFDGYSGVAKAKSTTKPKCPYCEMMVINNVPTHEQDCPRSKKPAGCEGMERCDEMKCPLCFGLMKGLLTCPKCGSHDVQLYFNALDIESGECHHCNYRSAASSFKKEKTCKSCFYKYTDEEEEEFLEEEAEKLHNKIHSLKKKGLSNKEIAEVMGIGVVDVEEILAEKSINKAGNKCPKDGTPLKFYDGSLGYEAMYCPKCGYFADNQTTGQDDFFIGLGKSVKTINVTCPHCGSENVAQREDSNECLDCGFKIQKSFEKGRKTLVMVLQENDNSIDDKFARMARQEGYSTEEIRAWIKQQGLDVKSVTCPVCYYKSFNIGMEEKGYGE